MGIYKVLPVSLLWLVVTMLHLAPVPTEGCMPPPGESFPSYSMEQVLHLAPVVLHARNSANHNTGDWDSEFDVLCVIKSPHPVDDVIAIHEGALRNSCSGTPEFVLGNSYVLALSGGASSATYFLAEPGIKASAAFTGRDDDLQAAVNICRMAPYNVTSGDRTPEMMAAECPTSTADDTTCIVPTSRSMRMTSSLPLIIALMGISTVTYFR